MSSNKLTPIKVNINKFTFTDNIFAIESSTLEVIASKISMYPFSFSRMNPISIISNKTGNIVYFEYSSKLIVEGYIMYVEYTPTQESIKENPKVKSLKIRIFNT